MPEPLPATAGPWLAERAGRDPDGLALVAGGARLAWRALAARVERMATALVRLGVGAGDRLAVALDASPGYVALVHAAQRIGAVFVPLNTRLAAPELAAIVAHAEPALVLRDAARAPALAAVRARCMDVAALDAPAIASPASAALDPAAVAAILYTSGTTGRPKGVVLTHASQRANADASRAGLGVATEDRWLCCLPLFHVGGLSIVTRSVLDGVPMVLHERFDARAVWDAITREHVTLLSLVPTMLHRLLAEVEAAPRAHVLRCVLVGGAALDPALHARARAAGLPVAATYGLTEAASQVATAAVDDPPGTVGRPLAGTTVRVADPDAGGCGEILVAGPTVMAGYFRDPEATATALRDGWLRTGDLGRVDADGRLYVLDRRADLVVTGGENVYPSEVEAVLLAHPAVADAAVYGVDDAEWGRRVQAAVVPRSGAALDEAALRAWCRARLAGYKTPRAIVAVPSLPRTASGKLRRHAVAAGAARAARCAADSDNDASDPAIVPAGRSVAAARPVSPARRRT